MALAEGYLRQCGLSFLACFTNQHNNLNIPDHLYGYVVSKGQLSTVHEFFFVVHGLSFEPDNQFHQFLKFFIWHFIIKGMGYGFSS